MAHPKGTSPNISDTETMQQVRDLVLGKDNHLIKQSLRDNAREIVGEVFSEALYDREKQDGSVNNVLAPLVEKSVQKSVANHSDQFVGYLYPIVGRLVRKSVTAFITELLEKTNTLIENSLTIKGLKWRFKARQAGVSFSQYAASQTFSFKVEQVFLIHRETGLLLNSVSSGLDLEADADMVSSMLTAINDFVSDSFKPHADSSEQQLDVVRTDDFTLLLKQGPQAIIVAAITGNMPQSVANQLQVTLEYIHKLYDKELTQFNGDADAFENSENQLQDCLIVELKNESDTAKKPPWFAWLILTTLFVSFGYMLTKRWQTEHILEKVRAIEQEPGIIIHHLGVNGLTQIELTAMRDPAAVSLSTWLEQNSIQHNNLLYTEESYLSLDKQLVRRKVETVLLNHPKAQVAWLADNVKLSGKMDKQEKLLLQTELSNHLGVRFRKSWLDEIEITNSKSTPVENSDLMQAVLDSHIAKLEKTTINFAQGENSISKAELTKLIDIQQQFAALALLAQQQRLSIWLIVMGSSDSLGKAKFNKILSQKRATNVQLELEKLGTPANQLNAIGLGVIDFKTTEEGARKVLFNVVYFDAN